MNIEKAKELIRDTYKYRTLYCPFLKELCIKQFCSLWIDHDFPFIDECSIHLLAIQGVKREKQETKE